MFQNRIEAGILLSKKLTKYKDQSAIVLGIPRGGIPVAFIVARELGLPLDIVLSKKIGHPMNKEYAIGAANLTDYFLETNEYVSKDYLQEELQKIRNRLYEMQLKFKGKKSAKEITGKTVIIIDDGLATGNTMLAAIKLVKKKNPKKIIVAIPVAPNDTFEKISKEVDQCISLIIPNEFHGVGQFYTDFEQVEDNEVKRLIDLAQ